MMPDIYRRDVSGREPYCYRLEVFFDGGSSACDGLVGGELLLQPVPLEAKDVGGAVEDLLEGFFAGGEDEVAGVFAFGDGCEFYVYSL